MTSRRTAPKQTCRVSSTKDEFVHECTCNVMLKQFQKDIKQLDTKARPCRRNVPPCKPSQMTPIKEKQSNCKIQPQTPAKNKTWFEVLAESPKRPMKEKNEINGCDPSCKYAGIFASASVPKYDEELSTNKVKQFGLLMDILSRKAHERNDRDLLSIVNEINNVVHSSQAQGDNGKVKSCKSSHFQNQDNFKKTYCLNERFDAPTKYNTPRKKPAGNENPVEKSNRDKDDIKLKALIKLLENMQSVSEKTEVQQESLKHLTEVINKLCKENKMLNELKDDRIALESKLASTITENKYLKERVQLLEIECKKSYRLLETKDEEIINLKNRVGKIRETITKKIDFGVNPEFDERSVTLDLDDTVATVPSCHESFDALIRPASSSPARLADPVKENKPNKRLEDEDSGIQSNAQDNDRNSRKLPTNYKNAILELKDSVKRAMEEFKLDTRLNDLSLDLSDATYKCSLSSLNLNS